MPRKRFPTLAAYLEYAKRRGETQGKFGSRVGASQSEISKIAAGKKEPDLSLALRIASAANIPIQSLIPAPNSQAVAS